MATAPQHTLNTVSINIGSGSVAVPVITGRTIYVLGRNGSGKSALVHRMMSQLPQGTYIPGSRPSYFDNDSLQLTPASRRQMEANWISWDRQPHTRYRPINGTQRNEKAILDLQSAETQFKVDAANDITLHGASSSAISRLQTQQSPFDRVNHLMRQANLPTQIVMVGGEMMAHRDGAAYSIAKMSDGERTALIMAAEIVSAAPMNVFVIDEPELHLHRSIVVPLIAALIRERPDCAFVVSTHELDLPAHSSDGSIILVRGCAWASDQVSWWDIDILPTLGEIPEQLRVDVLGSRRKIVFVEGTDTSLDQPLYALLFPAVSVRPKDTARDVRYAVQSLRALESVHHARAFGIVDNDTLSPERIEALRAEGVFALPVATVESLYYSDECINAVANQQAATLGGDGPAMATSARTAAIGALRDSGIQSHLASRVAELRLRDAAIGGVPDRATLSANGHSDFSITLPSPYPSELARLQGHITRDELGQILARYPVRESPVLQAIASALRFRDRADFERAVLARVSADASLRDQLKSKLSPLASELN